ncbi:MAG TPA: 50S ribosomal protein L11 methyltransferase [Candidatus Deferrimicrobiaceae bacterium]|nr:50S ribosomal protein L11 methyltransferase [Candidatus Deferrimicrobiaceae bacterium]
MTPSAARLRAFVRRHTRLVAVADAPGLRLRLADDAMAVLRQSGLELGEPDPPLPFWAFAWPGGLGLARYLADHPAEVDGRRVIDVASGSGLCAIAALRCGAAFVQAFDVDPLSEAAVSLNARANGVQIGFSRRDPLAEPAPDCDVILAGDVAYEETLAGRMFGWLRAAQARGIRVLVGDPGRTYLPPDLERLADYRVTASREIEDAELKTATVFTFRDVRDRAA